MLLKGNMAMRTIYCSPLFRHSIGFDRLQGVVDTALRGDRSDNSYPSFNIEQTSDAGYQITMAVAGFGEADLDITLEDNTLVVSGKLSESKDNIHPSWYCGACI